jgi:PAS domain S-box-containing protein
LAWVGKDPEALLGSHLTDLMGGAVYRNNEADIHAALRGELRQFDRPITKANGETGHAWVSYVPQVADGAVQGFLVVISDITDLKRTEAAWREEVQAREAAHALLSRSNTALQQAQRLGRIGSWAWVMQGDVVTWSDELFQILGCDPDSGTPSFAAQAALYQPESYARLQQGVQLALQTGQPYTLELACCRPDGVQAWVEARGEAMRDAVGQLTGLQGTVQDITQRKRAQTALADERLRLANIIEATQVGTWEWNVQTGEVKLNQRSAAMLGYGLEELGVQTNQFRLHNTHPDDHRQSAIAMKQHFAGLSEVYESEARMRHRDGHWVWILARGRVMTRTAAGEPEWMFGTHMDISERRRMDRLLADKTAELKRSNEELERFAYVASHDLQEPLRMVTSYGQLLMRRHVADLKPEAQTFVQFMVDGGQRAQALIRDLLSLARLDSQAQSWQPLSLNDAVADVLKQLHLRVQETGATVTVDDLPTVTADARQMGQLLSNLLGNALKFHGEAPPQVHVFASREADAWRIGVRDNGIGIEPRHFGRIFQMFQRLHLRSAYEGTGIGLTVCKKVVERHGGRIEVESAPGAGATFYFTLPDGAQALQRATLP